MKSIRARLVVVFAGIILLIISVLGLISVSMMTRTRLEDTYKELQSIAMTEAKFVASQRDVELRYVESLSYNPMLLDESIPLAERAAFFDSEAKRSGYVVFVYADRNGDSIEYNSGLLRANVKDRDYFGVALGGQLATSDILLSRATGQPVVVFASPVTRNNRVEGIFFGVREGGALSRIAAGIEIGETGYAYLVNNEGFTIGHPSMDRVLNRENVMELAKEDKGYAEIAKLMETEILKRTAGSGRYTFNGKTYITGFAPVMGSPWIMVTSIEESEVLANTYRLRSVLLILALLAILIGSVITVFVSGTISSPIESLVGSVEKMAQLDLRQGTQDKGFEKRQDEVGKLARAISAMQTNLVSVMDVLKKAADDVAETSQSLSASAEENSATIEEVASSVGVFSQGVGETEEKAKVMKQDASSIEELALAGNERMNSTKSSMTGIVNASTEIKVVLEDLSSQAQNMESILRIISDIADQTNLLALNAAIEAARAGDHGRGFAVVADEVRSLAEQTQRSVGDITNMINQLVSKASESRSIMDGAEEQTRRGNSLLVSAQEGFSVIAERVKQTVARIDSITYAIGEMSGSSASIAAATEEQAASMEEIASTTEVLATMGDALRDVVARFQIG